jgi:hypothetical protein
MSFYLQFQLKTLIHEITKDGFIHWDSVHIKHDSCISELNSNINMIFRNAQNDNPHEKLKKLIP